MRTFFHRNALLLILAIVFMASGLAYVVTVTGHDAETESRQQGVTNLEIRMQAQRDEATAQQQSVVDDSLGTNARRVSADTAAIRQFVKTVATWNSGTEYAAARESVMRRYKLAADSQFMKVYFQEPASNRDTSGETFYMVDAEGLNSSLQTMEVKVLGVSGTKYRYMVLAEIAAASSDGKASATRTSVIYLTLDGEGAMTEASGYASGSRALSSK